jgi:hypothetical protein
MAPRKNASKSICVAAEEDDVPRKEIQAAARASSIGPSNQVPEQSQTSIGHSRGTTVPGRHQEQGGDAPITAREVQHIIREELRQILQERDEIVARQVPLRRRSPSKVQLSAATRVSAQQRGIRNSPSRSRGSAFDRLGPPSIQERLGSRGAKLAKERQGQEERVGSLRKEARRIEVESFEESTKEAEDGGEVMSKHKKDEVKETSVRQAKTEGKIWKSKTPFGKDPNSPFAQAILDTPLPSDYKPPKISRYNGSTAPKAYVPCFRMAMAFIGYDEAAYCQAFPMTLEGPAQTWFTGLRPGSINKWDELVDAFQTRFFASSDFPRDTESLLNVVQKEGGCLK